MKGVAATLGEEWSMRLVIFAQGGASWQAPAVWGASRQRKVRKHHLPCSVKTKGFTEAQRESQDNLNTEFPGLSSQAGLLGEPFLSGVRIALCDSIGQNVCCGVDVLTADLSYM